MSTIAKMRALILLLAVIVATGARADDKSKCQLVRYSSLPMSTLSDGRIAVPVTVGGHPASFLVDTGGITATMSPQMAKDIGKSPLGFLNGGGLTGVAGALMSTFVRADFVLGGMKGSGLTAYIDPRVSSIGVDGTLAPDMMNHFDVDFDFANSTLNLFSQDHCPGQVVHWTKIGFIVIPMEVAPSGHIRVPVTINGKTVDAVMDTGSVTSVMSMSTAAALGIKPSDPDLKLRRSFGQDSRYKEYTYPFKTLALDGITVNNPHIIIMSDSTIGRLDSDMILGIGILRQLHLYVASWERKLYITPASAN